MSADHSQDFHDEILKIAKVVEQGMLSLYGIGFGAEGLPEREWVAKDNIEHRCIGSDSRQARQPSARTPQPIAQRWSHQEPREEPGGNCKRHRMRLHCKRQ